VELFRRADDHPGFLDRRRLVTSKDQVGGSGVIRHFADGTSELSLRDLAILMVVLSDNAATNILIDELGLESVNRTLRGLGLTETVLQRKMMDTQASAAGRENLSTPAEATALMARIHRCELPLSEDGCGGVRAILEIPKDDPFRRGVPVQVPVAFKAGWSGGIRTAWAMVQVEDRPYAVAVMTNYADDEEKDRVIQDVSAAAYLYFSKLAHSTPHGGRWR
jgi:beta-lactamase class A